MDMGEKIRTRIQQVPLGSEERNVLRSILGELSRVGACQSGTTFVHNTLKTNRELLRKLRSNNKDVPRIEFENEVLESLLDD